MFRALCRVLFLAGLGVWLAATPGWSQEQTGVWNRGNIHAALPSWMSPSYWSEQAGMEIWSSNLRSPGAGHGLLLTVVFRPQPGGFVRAIWRGATESVTLSADLTEGNPSWHQRSLFLDAARIGSAGQIWIEAKGATLERVQLEWMDGVGWGPAPKRGFVQTGSGRLLRAAELYGDSYLPEATESEVGVMEALLQTGPIPIQERSVRLHVPLAEKADYARLEFWVAGLAADESILFSLNDAPFEDLHPEVPRLEDPGYLHDRDQARTDLAGWRQVVRFLPGHLLRQGANTFWLGSGGFPGGGEVLVRDVRLQVVFHPKSASSVPVAEDSAAAPAPSPSAANTGLSFRAEGVDLRP